MTQDTSRPSEGAPKRPGQEPREAAMRRRFYTRAEAATEDDGFTVALDGRRLRTPLKQPLVLPTRPLAEAIAGEWSAQEQFIDPTTMPLTRMANTAIDAVAGRRDAVAADIVKYAGSDLLCYRAEAPEGLALMQKSGWDPLLDWASATHGAQFVVTTGLMPVEQPAAALARISDAVQPLDAFRLTAAHVMTTLTGSSVVALATLGGHLDAKRAWTLSHIDEDWQIAQWGWDAEAQERRQRRWAEMEAAAALVRLLGAWPHAVAT